MPESTLCLVSHHLRETQSIGAVLGALLTAGDVICLQGNLGSGKTSLTQGIGEGMQISDTVNSPTFVFIREHRPAQGNLYLYHVDLYRIDNPLEAGALGLTDYMYGDGVTVIEWAERARDLMPDTCLWITIDILQNTQRRLTFTARGIRYITLVEQLGASLVKAGILHQVAEGE